MQSIKAQLSGEKWKEDIEGQKKTLQGRLPKETAETKLAGIWDDSQGSKPKAWMWFIAEFGLHSLDWESISFQVSIQSWQLGH